MRFLLVHSDIRRLLARRASPSTGNRDGQIEHLLADIRLAFPNRPVLMPTFNYDFPSTGAFDFRNDPSQVGVLTERFRRDHAAWRTPTPIFSIAGEGSSFPLAPDKGVIEPFRGQGTFAYVAATAGTVLLLGCNVRSATLLHYAEVADGRCPVYRYLKDFPGTTVGIDGVTRPVILRYHVTNRERRVEYDFVEIDRRMRAAGALRDSRDFAHSCVIDAQDFVLAWQRESAADPLWPVAAESRAWVEPALARLGRGFLLSDVEGEQVAQGSRAE